MMMKREHWLVDAYHRFRGFPVLLQGMAGLLLLMLVIILLTAVVIPEARINFWSLHYIHTANHSVPETGFASQPPPFHNRAVVWLAKDAIAQGDLEKADFLVKPLAETGNKQALSVLGDILAAKGNYDDALDAWKKANDYYAVMREAALLADKGDLDDVELAYRAAWEINPQKATLPLAKFLWQKRNRPEDAEKLIQDALLGSSTREYPGTLVEYYTTLGNVLRAQGRYRDAVSAYRNVLQGKPDDINILHLMGWVYYDAGDTEQAIQVFNQEVANHPGNYLGYYDLARFYSKNDMFEDAEKLFEIAMDKKEDIPWVWVQRANNFRSAKQYSDALVLYQKTNKKFPDFAQGYYEIAWCYRMMGDYRKALDEIERAISLKRTPNEWYYVRAGQIYELNMDKDKAIKAYSKALDINPENITAQRKLIQLDKN